MENDEIVNIDTPNDEVRTTEDLEAIRAENQRIKEQNARLFERAKRAEGFTKDSDGNWVKKEKPQSDDITSKQGHKPSDILKADEFKLYRQGYSEEEIDLVMHNGGIKALADEKSPLAMGLKFAREQRLAEEASGKVADTSGQSEVERKYTPEQMRSMKKEDLAKLIGYANSN